MERGFLELMFVFLQVSSFLVMISLQMVSTVRFSKCGIET